jgi:hypothetical protein
MFLGIISLRLKKDIKKTDSCLFDSISHYDCIIKDNINDLNNFYKMKFSRLILASEDKYILNLSIINIDKIKTEQFFIEFNNQISDTNDVIECSIPVYKNIHNSDICFSRGSKRYFYINKDVLKIKKYKFTPSRNIVSLDHKIFPHYSKEGKCHNLIKDIMFDKSNSILKNINYKKINHNELDSYICQDYKFKDFIKSEENLIIKSGYIEYLCFCNIENVVENVIPINSITNISSSFNNFTVFRNNDSFDCFLVDACIVTINVYDRQYKTYMFKENYNKLKKYFKNKILSKSYKIKL